MFTSRSSHPREIAAVEAALTTLVRRAKLPDAHAAVAQSAGIALDRAAYVVLARIGEWGPLRLSELSERLRADVSTASRHVHHLELDGYVDRAEDPSDRRAWLLSLTPSGADAVARVRRHAKRRSHGCSRTGRPRTVVSWLACSAGWSSR